MADKKKIAKYETTTIDLGDGNELTMLEPHPDDKGWIHGFLSHTFEYPLENDVLRYIKNLI